jgi:hypothetical protein
VSKRLLILASAAAFLVAACSDLTEGDVTPGSGARFVPQVVDFVDNAGLGNEVTVDKDGVPYISYFVFPAVVKPGDIPITRPIGAPYIKTAPVPAAGDTPAQPGEDGAAVALSSLSGDGIWTRGAAAQVRDTPGGVTIPYGPATEESLIGATPKNTNGTDTAIDASGGKHVAWAGKDGIYYAYGAATGSFAVEQVYDFGYNLQLAGPIGRPSVVADDSGAPWVAYAVVSGKVEIQVATKSGEKWTTTTIDTLDLCNGCPQPGPTRIGVTPDGPVVAYAVPGANQIKVARLIDGAWATETAATGVSGAGLSLAIGEEGAVELSFYDGKGAVNLAVSGSGGWTTSKVADAVAATSGETGTANGNFAQTTGVAVDDNGTSYVTFYDATTGAVALWKGDGTTFTAVATSDTVGGSYPSVAVSPDGAHVFVTWYGVENQDLRMGIQGDPGDLAIAAPSPPATGAPVAAPSGCGDDGKVALALSAAGVQFDTACLVAPAGQDFEIDFDNKDAGVPHNVAVSTDPAYAEFLFTGDLITGPETIVYDVTKSSGPLDAATYYFRCDVHPAMAGTLEVVKAKGK